MIVDRTALVSMLLAAMVAWAAEESARSTADATGYVMGRFVETTPRLDGPLSAADIASEQLLLEVNTQVRFDLPRRSKVYGDVSLINQAGFRYLMLDANETEHTAKPRDVQVMRPFVSINELYALIEAVPALNFVVGKKRIVWGAGMAYKPTDLLNPRRDPTDPSSQRAGAWIAQIEIPLETVTVSLLFSPQVMRQANGIPYQWAVHPEWDKKDDAVHALAVARVGALVFDSDVNLMLFSGNQYGDAFRDKFRLGASVSRNFFEVNELHAETLLFTGSSRLYFDGGCVGSQQDALRCVVAQKPMASRSMLNDRQINASLLAGGRRTFDDDSVLSIEYLLQTDGYSRDQVQDQVNAFDLISRASRLGLPVGALPGAADFLGTTSSDTGIPVRLSFQPTAQHYLFLSFQKPRIFDDFTAQLVVVANLQDFSTLWTPSVSWSATEWMTLSLFGMLPLIGPHSLAASIPSSNDKATEFGLLPLSYRVFAEVRVFY